MDKLEQLFVRACKSKDPKVRLVSLYKRFFYINDDPTIYIVIKLAQIVEKYSLCGITDIVQGLNPTEDIIYREPPKPYNERCLKFLINKIRFAEVKKFQGLARPLQFK